MTPRPPVLLDARDADATPLRGTGRYALELSRRLPPGLVGRFRARTGAPQILEEQLVLPLVSLRTGTKVVHAPNCFLPLARRAAGVVTIHDLAFEAFPRDFSARTGRKFRWIAPRAARSAARVIVPSRATADDVVTRYGIHPGKVRVIPNAASLPIGDAPPPAWLAEAGPYVLVVGDLRAKKNLARVVEAWDALRRAGTVEHDLVFAGQGDVTALGLAAGAPPPPGVHVTGFLPDAELDAAFRGAALVVHASRYEGFGLVVVEAMARGVPVAIADATSLPEVAGDAAERFDPLDADDLAAAVVRALSPERAAELSRLGRARAGSFSWQRTADATADVYRELL